MSISLASHEAADFGYAARVAAHLADAWEGLGVPPGVSLNVNVPALPPQPDQGAALHPPVPGHPERELFAPHRPQGAHLLLAGRRKDGNRGR